MTTLKTFQKFWNAIYFPSGLLTNQLKVILVRLEQQERTLPNVKHPTATFISYLISFTILPTLEKKSSIINKYRKDLNVIIFSPFKLSATFSPKDFVADSLMSTWVVIYTDYFVNLYCIIIMADDKFETSKHVPKTEKRCCVFKDNCISFLCLGHLYCLQLLITTFQAVTFSHIFKFLRYFCHRYLFLSPVYIYQSFKQNQFDSREFNKITTTATATGTSLNKRFNEQNNDCARAL